MIFGVRETSDFPPLFMVSDEWMVKYDENEKCFVLLVYDVEYEISNESYQMLSMIKDKINELTMIEIDVLKKELRFWN